MTDREATAGRCLMVGIAGPRLSAHEREALEALGPGGAILFRRNLVDPEQTMALLEELREHLASPPLLALDQEGGRVSRLLDWIGPTPTAQALAAAGTEITRSFARETGRALSALGFNVDFAPVVDLCAAAATNGIADRSFGTDPERVSELGRAFLAGLRDAGIAGCLKHFPGLGDTAVDSHIELPLARRDRSTLEREDLVPYRRLAREAPLVMVGHAHYPALDPTPGRPATLSHAIVTGLLRESIGFAGLVVSDDLEMGAVAPLDADGAAAVGTLAAGCDLILYCSDLARARRARDAMAAGAARSAALDARLAAAAEATRRTAAAWPTARPGPAAWAEARSGLARIVAEVGPAPDARA